MIYSGVDKEMASFVEVSRDLSASVSGDSDWELGLERKSA
jgi:hypothetical protein